MALPSDEVWAALAWGAVSVQQPVESEQPGSGVAIALGNALDAAPEAMVSGITLRDRGIPLALVFAFSVSNLPEALSSAAGMRVAGRSYPYILLVWSAIAIGAAVATRQGMWGSARSVRRGHRGCRHLAPEHCSR